MIQLHVCTPEAKAALMELVEEKHEQFLGGKWVPFDPVAASCMTNSGSKPRAKAPTQGTRKRKPAKRKANDCDDFLNDVESESGEEELHTEEDSDEESEDEEAALLRAAAEVIGADEAGIDAASPPKKPKKSHREAKVLATESILEKKKEKEWVQCDGCNKWRALPRFANAESLPDVWLCEMMKDILCSSRLTCDSPQEPLPPGFEEELEEEEAEAEETEQQEENATPIDKENQAPIVEKRHTNQVASTNVNLIPSA